jgi:LAGLIDADG endonuclease
MVSIVTGVVLANASIDISLHDTQLFNNMSDYDLICSFNLLKPDESSNYISNNKLSSNYIKKFWVGLMDGDGSIQVNHWRKKSLQYRLVIKLKYCSENINMLNLIKDTIGGNINIINDKFVIWVVNYKGHIIKLNKILISYPPLTSRLQAQINFMKECLKRNDIEWYLSNRYSKYLNRETSINTNVPYFKEWLSGFIEAEGSFSIRKSNNHSFSIGQYYDRYLIEAIKNHFQIQSQVRNSSKNFWSVETYRHSTLINLIEHLNEYPLLGEKSNSYFKFKGIINQ